MPKWNGLYVLKMSPDTIIHNSAALYRDWHQLDQQHRFSERVGGKDNDGWSNVQMGEPLQALGLGDKLMIVAHGTTDKVADKDANALASWLRDICGLQAVGLITFKSCQVGRGSFLQDFRTACTNSKIKVGWLKGYRGNAGTITTNGKPTERVSHVTSSGIKKGGKRYTIVKGTHPFPVDNSRYFHDSDDRALALWNDDESSEEFDLF